MEGGLPDLSPEELRRIEAAASAARPLRSTGPYIDLRLLFPEAPNWSAQYAVRRLASKRATRIKVFGGSDDTLRIWLNGAEVHKNCVGRTARPDQDMVAVDLPAGASTLMVEVCQLIGAWGFFLRIEDEYGRKLRLGDDDRLEALGEDGREPERPARSR